LRLLAFFGSVGNNGDDKLVGEADYNLPGLMYGGVINADFVGAVRGFYAYFMIGNLYSVGACGSGYRKNGILRQIHAGVFLTVYFNNGYGTFAAGTVQ